MAVKLKANIDYLALNWCTSSDLHRGFQDSQRLANSEDGIINRLRHHCIKKCYADLVLQLLLFVSFRIRSLVPSQKHLCSAVDLTGNYSSAAVEVRLYSDSPSFIVVLSLRIANELEIQFKLKETYIRRVYY